MMNQPRRGAVIAWARRSENSESRLTWIEHRALAIRKIVKATALTHRATADHEKYTSDPRKMVAFGIPYAVDIDPAR